MQNVRGYIIPVFSIPPKSFSTWVSLHHSIIHTGGGMVTGGQIIMELWAWPYCLDAVFHWVRASCKTRQRKLYSCGEGVAYDPGLALAYFHSYERPN